MYKGDLPYWISNVTFSFYLLNNNFMCPYPPIPANVRVDDRCTSSLFFPFFLLIVINII